MGNRSQFGRTYDTGARHHHRGSISQQVLKTDLHHSKTANTDAADQLWAEVDYGQEAIRAGAESLTGATRYDQTPRADARRPTAIHGAAAAQERPRYSGIDRLIEQIGRDQNTRAGTLTDVVQAVANFNDRTNERVQWMDRISERARNNASIIDKRVIGFRKRTDSARRAVEDVSEYDSAARLSQQRYDAIRERYHEVGERIERISERTEQNRAVTSENNRIADGNTRGSEEIKHATEQVTEVIKAKEKEVERARAPTRSRSPSMGR